MNCQVNLKEVRNFYRIFDKDNDDDLTYQEFCDAFLPIDTQFANEMAMKAPQDKFREVDFGDDEQMYTYRKTMFTNVTRDAFIEVWRTHFGICASLL